MSVFYDTGKKRKDVIGDYDGFVEKFKPKKTTDDCYTPNGVYQVVLDWVRETANLPEDTPIIRPFYPGGDYERYDYPEGCVVVDNPPFSILSKIIDFYQERGIRFFLFAPHLTLFSTASRQKISYIVADAVITYENGAKVNTSFISNLFGDLRVWLNGDLKERIRQEQDRAKAPELPKYEYPPVVVNSTRLGKLINPTTDIKISSAECAFIRRLESQKEIKKAIFGGGFLISEAVAEQLRIEGEKIKEKQPQGGEPIYFPLSEVEQNAIKALNQKKTPQRYVIPLMGTLATSVDGKVGRLGDLC